MTQRRTINSLQGLRAIMMFIVVFAHLFGINIVYGGAGEVMPFFFVLSGFVLTLAYGNKDIKLNLKSEGKFLLKRLKKVYPLYFVMLLIMAIYYISLTMLGKTDHSVLDYIKYFITDIFMVQSWIPKKEYYMSLNGVSWFLATLVFCYIIFLPVSKVLKRIQKSQNVGSILAIGILFLTIVYQILAKKIFLLEEYYTYVFPIYRCLEFILGMVLAMVFHRRNAKEKTLKYTIFESLIVGFFVVEYIVLKFISIPQSLRGLEAVPQLIICTLMVYVFAIEGGYISKFLSNKLFLWFASISFEVYLIHQGLQNILGTVLNQIHLNQLTGIITFVLSILSALIWQKIQKRAIKKQ